MKLSLVLVFILGACGSDDNERRNNNYDDFDPYLTDNSELEYYDTFKQKNGEPFPMNKLPSVLKDGEMIDICKPGQMFHNDECFDKIHLTETPGFTIEKDGKSITVNGNDLSKEFLDSFSEISPSEDNTYRRQRHTVTECTLPFIKCPSPAFWGQFLSFLGFNAGAITTQKIGLVEKIQNISISTKFIFPDILNLIPRTGLEIFPNHWDLRGTFTLKGQKLNFPITRKEIQNIVGSEADTSSIPIKNGRLKLWYGNFDSKSPNRGDHKLIIIEYEMDYDDKLDSN